MLSSLVPGIFPDKWYEFDVCLEVFILVEIFVGKFSYTLSCRLGMAEKLSIFLCHGTIIVPSCLFVLTLWVAETLSLDSKHLRAQNF